MHVQFIIKCLLFIFFSGLAISLSLPVASIHSFFLTYFRHLLIHKRHATRCLILKRSIHLKNKKKRKKIPKIFLIICFFLRWLLLFFALLSSIHLFFFSAVLVMMMVVSLAWGHTRTNPWCGWYHTLNALFVRTSEDVCSWVRIRVAVGWSLNVIRKYLDWNYFVMLFFFCRCRCWRQCGKWEKHIEELSLECVM